MIIEMDYVLEGHESLELTLEVDVELDVDNNYGADADGNRGIRVEELIVNGFECFYEEKLTCLPDFIYNDIDAFLEEHHEEMIGIYKG